MVIRTTYPTPWQPPRFRPLAGGRDNIPRGSGAEEGGPPDRIGTIIVLVRPPGQITVGQEVTLTAARIGGSAPLTYQWSGPSGVIPGATGSSYTFTPTSPSDSGTYTCTVTSAGAVDSPKSAGASITVDDVGVTEYQLVPDSEIQAAATLDPSSYQLGQEFNVTSSAWVTAIKFYRPVTNTNSAGLDARTWVVKLWQNSQPIGSGTVSTALNQTGWITATLESPIAVTTGVTYSASYFVPPETGYPARAAYLASGLAPGGGNPLVAAAGSGKFRDLGPHQIPSEMFNNGFYFITPVVVTSLPAGVLNNLWTPPSVGELVAPSPEGPYELGMRYTVTDAQPLVAVRFFRAATESAGNNTVRVWNSGGTQLSSATTSTVVNGGYITVPLPGPVALSAGQEFTVSVNNYTRIQINAQFDANINRAVPGGVVRGSAVNTGGPGAFPATINNTEYFVQPILDGGMGMMMMEDGGFMLMEGAGTFREGMARSDHHHILTES